MMKSKIKIYHISLLSLLVILQCQGPSRQPSNTIFVTASFYPLYYFASQIGGDRVTVTNITPAGAEPHDYEPTPRQIAEISASKLLILNGAGMEPWAKNIVGNIDTNETKVLIISEGVPHMLSTADNSVVDPHFWLDPPLAMAMVHRITGAFMMIDPSNKEYFRTNADTLLAKLRSLDADYGKGLSNCATKYFITSHAAFGYLAYTYGLKQVPITGLSPDAEPSPQKLAELATFAKRNNIKYIFFERLVSPKLAQTLAAEVGAQTLVLNPIEGLTPEEQAQGRDYFTEMRANLTNLEKALGCNK